MTNPLKANVMAMLTAEVALANLAVADVSNPALLIYVNQSHSPSSFLTFTLSHLVIR